MKFQPSHLSDLNDPQVARPNLSFSTALPCIKLGEPTGPIVDLLHQELAANGFKVRGERNYGPKTVEAVKAYQRASNIYVDGQTGPQTWAQLGYPGKPCSGGEIIGTERTVETGAGGILGPSAPSIFGGEEEEKPWYTSPWFVVGVLAATGIGILAYQNRDRVQGQMTGLFAPGVTPMILTRAAKHIPASRQLPGPVAGEVSEVEYVEPEFIDAEFEDVEVSDALPFSPEPPQLEAPYDALAGMERTLN